MSDTTTKMDSERHEEAAVQFMAEIDNVLLDAFGMGKTATKTLFTERERLSAQLRGLLQNSFMRGWNTGNADALVSVKRFVDRDSR
ncbi:hypothetical protein LCGC14_1468380 [marine sediment metagenome]|uniref:Uncharacterized protein n=1 Tax=marine sediment metagenome TaxID=412755 RepID=A0A0F9LTI0_9ZZZZ